MAERWHLNGQVLVACNCDWGCPCDFNAPPTTGKCEGGWTWHVEGGTYGDVRLDKRADLGATARFLVSRGVEYDHSDQNLAVGPFEYSST